MSKIYRYKDGNGWYEPGSNCCGGFWTKSHRDSWETIQARQQKAIQKETNKTYQSPPMTGKEILIVILAFTIAVVISMCIWRFIFWLANIKVG